MSGTATSSDPHGHHDWHSEEYVRGWIEGDVTRDGERRPVLRRMVRLLPFEGDAAIRVLDVGGGYGMLTREVLEEYPNSRVVLHDFSGPMLAHAARRLAGALDRVQFARADLRDPAWTDAVGGPFDAVVSSITLHNVREPERVRAIYREIRPLVGDGGCLANLDLTFPGLEVEAQLAWLAEAGFRHVHCPFEYERQALVMGFTEAAPGTGRPRAARGRAGST